MHIHSLHIYPVKSLRGCDVVSVELDELGFVGDRRFMVVDEQGGFLTQRTIPAMAMVSTALRETALTLSAESLGCVSVSLRGEPGATPRPVALWSERGLLAEDAGDEVAEWLAHVLGVRCRLVRIGSGFHRRMTGAAARAGDLVSFADAAPVHITSISSLDDLNCRIHAHGGDPVPMSRFRPNLVIAGGAPFAEDGWTALTAGGVLLRMDGPTERCAISAIDQHSAQRGVEPLRTLSTFRSVAARNAVCFGVNCIQESKSGRLSVGDAIATPSAHVD